MSIQFPNTPSASDAKSFFNTDFELREANMSGSSGLPLICQSQKQLGRRRHPSSYCSIMIHDLHRQFDAKVLFSFTQLITAATLLRHNLEQRMKMSSAWHMNSLTRKLYEDGQTLSLSLTWWGVLPAMLICLLNSSAFISESTSKYRSRNQLVLCQKGSIGTGPAAVVSFLVADGILVLALFVSHARWGRVKELQVYAKFLIVAAGSNCPLLGPRLPAVIWTTNIPSLG